ncbi:hypothetical protein AB0D56_10050 [Streptomyces sp. NPDC048209]|uniref:hypothetical protein n=1 Tax=Streptomyces sp. NPDC048209 TaxID=3156689 RepID=UPI003433CEF7
MTNSDARARLHAMFNLSEADEAELNARIDAVIAEAQPEPTPELVLLRAESSDLDHLRRNELPRMHREIEHHKDGKARWRGRAEKAEARVAELQTAATAALAPHRKSPDSPHCSSDGDQWPCHTVYVLEPTVAPRDLRPGADAARRMLRDRQDAEETP